MSASDTFGDVDEVGRNIQSGLMGSSRYIIVLVCALLTGCFEQPAEPAPAKAHEIQAAASAIELSSRVTDQADLLSEAQEVTISTKLERLEAATQHQMVVATVPSLGGQEIAAFTTDLANAWGIGRRDFDDGVVILIAPNERKVRIAVGYGLEDTLTNELCAEVIEKVMLPKFSEGDYYGGANLGVDALISALQ